MNTFTFNFPDKYNLSPISTTSETNECVVPALYKIMNNDNFLGWRIKTLNGVNVESAEILTKGQIIEFTNIGQSVAIGLQDEYAPNVYIDFVWETFGDKEGPEVQAIYADDTKVETIMVDDVIVEKIVIKE